MNEKSEESQNPFAAPQTSAAENDHVGELTTEEEDLRAFVGKRSEYYLKQWDSVLKGGDKKTGFNAAAFFFSGFWLPFRKMYFVAGVFYFAVVAEAILQQVIVVEVMDKYELSEQLDRILGILFGAIVGGYANKWYLTHARNVIAEVRLNNTDDESVRKILAKRGGTSLGFGLALFIGFFITLILTVTLIDFIFHPELY